MNETLLLLQALLCAGFVYLAWKVDKERLYSAVVIFLILISIVGVKTVEFFGFQTNTGNIFYASVFLATYFLIERYGRHEGIRSIWIGTICVVFFAGLVRISLLLAPAPGSALIGDTLSSALTPALRLAFASLVAYVLSQSVNVYLYLYLKESLSELHLWLRVNLTNMIAQGVDSIVFFMVGFWGVVAPSDMWEILLTGYLIKITFMMLASPMLYLNNTIEEDDQQLASVTRY